MANPTAGRPADLGVRRDLCVLIVDDQSEIHDDFRESLGRDAGMASDEAAASFGVPPTRSKLPAIELLHANDGESACALLEGLCQAGRQVAVAYVDIRMPPGIDGVETVRRMRSIDSDIEIVIMTAYTDKPLRDIVSGMTSLHKLLYIRKPFAPEEVQQITTALALKWSFERDLAASRRRLDEEEQRLRAVLDATGDAVALYDDASLVFANRSYEALFGMSFAELCGLSRNAAGKRFKDVFPSRFPVVSGTGAAAGEVRAGFVELVSAPSASEEGQVFHRSWRPVRDGKSDRVIGDLVVYRDVSDGVENERMRAEVQRLRSQVEDVFAVNGIVGSSAEMQDVRELLQRAVETDVTVLVKGESGTGKELVARAMHFNSRRRKGPFVAVNVSAIPETLIESELFGHERGAFTGAIGRRIGCFEEAEGGTLLLDEIGDIPVQLQAKLLRVLQERQIRRVGGGTSVPVDVRIVAATNSDIEARMRDGTFREDLYYRLAVFPITLPPLRTRGEGDILLLAGHFLKKHADRMGRSVHGISVSAARLLTRYRWPGNVRELENVICRGLVLETTDVLQSDRLPPEIAAVTDEDSPPPASSLEEAEKQAIARALEASSHNLTRAARILDIDRSTLHRKLKKHGLGPTQE